MVSNVAPRVALNDRTNPADNLAVLVGETAVARGNITDPGTDGGTLRIDWGDGTPATTVSYPCASGCPVQTTPTFQTGWTIGCPDVDYFFSVSHLYTQPSGPQGFPLTVSATDDDGGVSPSATRAIDVKPAPNAQPIATDVSLQVNEDENLTIGITNSITDDLLSGSEFTPEVIVAPLRGALTPTQGGWRYRPAPDFFGTDSFTYRITDGGSPTGCQPVSAYCLAPESDTATVSIGVLPMPDAPTVTRVSPVPAGSAPTFEVTFDMDVTDFDDANDVIVSGTARPTTVTITPINGRTYRVVVTGMAGDGDVSITVTGGSAIYADGQSSVGSEPTTVVYDTTAPVIVLPGSVVRASAEPGRPGATVTYTVTADDFAPVPEPRGAALRIAAFDAVALGAAPSLLCTPASGSFFPIGATTVNCTAADTAGNVSRASFAVTVTDSEAPVITGVSQSFSLPVGAASGAIPYVSPTATDNSGSATITCTPASGATFAAGINTITCTANDPSNNTVQATYTITASAFVAPAQPASPAANPPSGPIVPASGPIVPFGGLPATGGNPNALLVLALAALLLGGLTLAGSRRRRYS